MGLPAAYLGWEVPRRLVLSYVEASLDVINIHDNESE